MKDLSISSPLKEVQKVGIVHHPFCLKHSAEDHLDIEVSKLDYNHPERPQRVLAILDHLTKQKLL